MCIPSNRSVALVVACPTRFVAVHLISPSSPRADWWMTSILHPFSVDILCLRLLNTSKPSLYHEIRGVGVPLTSTLSSICMKNYFIRLPLFTVSKISSIYINCVCILIRVIELGLYVIFWNDIVALCKIYINNRYLFMEQLQNSYFLFLVSIHSYGTLDTLLW